MTETQPRTSLPRLAYVYDPLSFAPLSIVDAARGVCDLVWVVDSSQPGSSSMQRLLRRTGPTVEVSGTTISDVAAELRTHGVDGVVSLHDGGLVWTAALAAELGLPFHSVDTAIRLTDKSAQRAALGAAGLAVPTVRVIPLDADEADLERIGSRFPFPAVLKPRVGYSSRDTTPVASSAELLASMAEYRTRTEPTPGEFVLESYIPDPSTPLGGEGFAPFVSVESVVEGGRVAHASISSRTPFRWPFRETGLATPTVIEPALQQEIMRVAGRAAQALGVTVGCLHTEIKLTDDGPVVVEVNGRPGGGVSEMLERASGFSILRTALRLAVGEPVNLAGPVECRRIGYLINVFPVEELEWIDSVEGLAELAKVEGVDEITVVRGPGQRIDWREGSEVHVFHIAGSTATFAELRTLIGLTTSLVRIEGHNTDPQRSATGSASLS